MPRGGFYVSEKRTNGVVVFRPLSQRSRSRPRPSRRADHREGLEALCHLVTPCKYGDHLWVDASGGCDQRPSKEPHAGPRVGRISLRTCSGGYPFQQAMVSELRPPLASLGRAVGSLKHNGRGLVLVRRCFWRQARQAGASSAWFGRRQKSTQHLAGGCSNQHPLRDW